MKSSSAIFIILGSFIGAGFATGKEIFVFYGMYGFVGIANILLTMILLYFILVNYFTISNKFNVNNFKQASIYITKKPMIIDILLLICFIIVSSALFASVNEFDAYLNIPKNFNIKIMGIITLIFVFFTSLGDMKSLSKVSSLVVPIIIVFFVFICTYSIIVNKFQFINFTFKNNIIVSVCNGISYAGINTILSIQLLFGISKDIKNVKKVSIISVIIFVVVLMLGLLAILTSSEMNVISSMPLLNIANDINVWLGYCYLIIMWFAIITSLLSTIYSIKSYLKVYIKNNVLLTLILCVVCYLFSFVGFGNLVEFLYPAIGAFGIVYFIMFVSSKSLKDYQINAMYKNTNNKIKMQ